MKKTKKQEQGAKVVRTGNHLVMAGRKGGAHRTRREKAESKYRGRWA